MKILRMTSLTRLVACAIAAAALSAAATAHAEGSLLDALRSSSASGERHQGTVASVAAVRG